MRALAFVVGLAIFTLGAIASRSRRRPGGKEGMRGAMPVVFTSINPDVTGTSGSKRV